MSREALRIGNVNPDLTQHQLKHWRNKWLCINLRQSDDKNNRQWHKLRCKINKTWKTLTETQRYKIKQGYINLYWQFKQLPQVTHTQHILKQSSRCCHFWMILTDKSQNSSQPKVPIQQSQVVVSTKVILTKIERMRQHKKKKSNIPGNSLLTHICIEGLYI
jgi:hypothetical protein